MSLPKTWSNESVHQVQSFSRPSADLTRPRKHARRTSLPVSNKQSPSTSHLGPNATSLGLGGLDTSNYSTERRKFREALNGGVKRHSSTGRGKQRSASSSSKSLVRPTFELEVEGDDEDEETDEVQSAMQSSTTYAAGPSGAGWTSGEASSSDASSSDRHAFDWDIAKKRSSAPNALSSLSQHQQRFLQAMDIPQGEKAKRRSFQANGSRESSVPDTPTGKKRELEPGEDTRWASTSSVAARNASGLVNRSNGTGSPSGASRFSPTGAEVVSVAQRRANKAAKRLPLVRSSLEAGMLVAAGCFACFRLFEHPDELIRQHIYELAYVVASSALYCLLRSSDENGVIWATDERNYRPSGDDGAICGLLFGPLLAVTSLFTSLADQTSARPASGDSLVFPPWRIESPQPILGSRSVPHPRFSALTLSRCTLLSLQTLTATTLLAHLLATRWIRKPSTFPQSNWRKLWSFIKFSHVVALLLAGAREAFAAMHIPIWTDLTRSELIVTALFFQCNLYTISRLARMSFTLGELGIVATVGVTLSIETLNLTMAKLLPATTLYVKTFRRPTPLLVFQLALVVGTFMIGFLLSPLLYLSRHLAQKPVHRLRWPHKRDLHRRLLAGFFYFFAALFVVGVLGLWVWWMLGKRNPWLWTIHFVLEGKFWWSRPLLIGYWVLLVGISITGWQATVLSGKRLRLRPAVSIVNAQQGNGSAGRLKKSASSAAKDTSEASLKSKATLSHASNGGEVGGMPNGSLSFPRKAAYLSLNARRKFFHALAVVLFAPGIAYDAAFTHLAFSLAFSAFIMAEYIRYYALYPFGAVLHVFMSEFTDHKDSGPVILSHFYLLTGCAAPLWIEGVRSASNTIVLRGGGSWLASRATDQVPATGVDISMFIGVLTLGVGDALASIVGRRYGRLRWPRSSKTIEGSLAFVLSIYVSALLLRAIGWCTPFPVSACVVRCEGRQLMNKLAAPARPLRSGDRYSGRTGRRFKSKRQPRPARLCFYCPVSLPRLVGWVPAGGWCHSG